MNRNEVPTVETAGANQTGDILSEDRLAQREEVEAQESPPTMPPNLSDYLTYGFNARTSTLSSSAVFMPTFTPGELVEYAADGLTKTTYRVPDGVTFHNVPSNSNVTQATLMRREEDYSQNFSYSHKSSSKVPLDVGVSYSHSSQSTYVYNKNLFQSQTQAYCLNFQCQTVYSITLDPPRPSYTTAGFVAAISLLPTQIATALDLQTFFDFFDKYGTHYLLAGTFGGYICMNSSINISYTETTTDSTITKNISNGFSAMGAQHKTDTSVAKSNSTVLSNTDATTQISIGSAGGFPVKKDMVTTSWPQSCFSGPVLLLGPGGQYIPEMAPLADLANANQQVAMNRALVAYLSGSKCFGQIRDIGLGTDKAPTDGLLFGRIGPVADGDYLQAEAYADNAQSPTTLQANASVSLSQASSTFIGQAGFMTPVRQNQYFNTSGTIGSGTNPPYALSVVPLLYPVPGSASGTESVLGAEQLIQAAQYQSYTPPTDGFLLAYLSEVSDGDNASVTAKDITLGGAGDFVGATAIHGWKGGGHWIPEASFCVPVTKKKQYQLAYTSWFGSPSYSFRFIPLTGGLGWGTITLINGAQPTNTTGTPSPYIATADTDGFLVASYIVLPQYSGSGWNIGAVQIYVNADRSRLSQVPPRGAAAYDWDPKNHKDHKNIKIPFATVTVPILKGESYSILASYQTDNGTVPYLRVFWVPCSQS